MAACNEGDISGDKMAAIETSTMQDEQEDGKEENRMILFRKIMNKCLGKIMSAGRSVES